MKPFEILSALPMFAKTLPETVFASPAFSVECRLGDETISLRHAQVMPADTLDIQILIGEEPHTLCIERSARFAELNKIWDSKSDIPEPILLALIEKECGAFLQMLENVIRRRIRISDLAVDKDNREAAPLCAGGIVFALTKSSAVVSALGALRNLDLSTAAIRDIPLEAQAEYAAFALSSSDIASLSSGDALLLPEIGSIAPRLIVAGRFIADDSGVSLYSDDGRYRVVAQDPLSLTLGELFDASTQPSSKSRGVPTSGRALRLIHNSKTVATGHLDRLASQNAFIAEAIRPTSSNE